VYERVEVSFFQKFGIIILVMIIGLIAIGCENPSGGGGKNKDNDTLITETPTNNGETPSNPTNSGNPANPSDPVPSETFKVTFMSGETNAAEK
jgi:hypothetical protein